jgi:hypothetical protein
MSVRLRCEGCGKLYWRRQGWQHEGHVSSPGPSRVTSPVVVDGEVVKPEAVLARRARRVSQSAAVSQLANEAQLASSTYRHRDVEKRRAYQRDLMRSRRLAARRVSG